MTPSLHFCNLRPDESRVISVVARGVWRSVGACGMTYGFTKLHREVQSIADEMVKVRSPPSCSWPSSKLKWSGATF